MKRLILCMLLIPGVIPAAAQQSPSKTPAKPDAAATADNTGKPPKKKLDADLSGFDLSDDKSKKVSTMFGGSRGVAFPSATLYAPKRAKLYGGPALFQWTSEGHNDGYVFLITDEDETQIVKQPLTESHFRLPSLTGKLQPGEAYYWRVQVLPSTVAGEPLEIVMASAAERRQIDKELAAANGTDAYQTALSRAQVYRKHRLWFDAIGAYTDIIEKYPDRAELYEQRGAIYSQIDSTSKLGEADASRAAMLAKSAH
jgi:hypothetical protein